MIPLPELPSGIYQHYKGNFYQVFGYAHDANAENLSTWGVDHHGDLNPLGERVVVVYIGLELDGAHTGPRLAVRSVDDFFKLVCWNGECRRYGEGHLEEHTPPFCSSCTQPLFPRFQFIETQWSNYAGLR